MSIISKTQIFKLYKKGSQSYTSVEAEQQGDSNQWMALCPFHNDHNPSLSINSEKGVWFCHGCSAKGPLWDESFEPIKAPAGLSQSERLKWLKERIKENRRLETAKVLATYDYLDENNVLLYRTVKVEAPPPKNKSFYQKRPDGKGGWINSIQGVRRVLYHLPELINGDDPVFIPEGEKDVDRLREFDCTATCNPMGAGKWSDGYNQCLKGREVIILADNDQPGKDHASDVARSLYGTAKSIVVVNFPELPEKGDVSDFLDARKDQKDQGLDDLLDKIADAPQWEPEPQLQSDDYVFVDGNTVLSVEEPEVSWLWDGILPTAGLGLILGKPKTGKTVLGINFGVWVSRGGIFLGRTVSQGPVIYLALEEIRGEIRKYLHNMGGDFPNIYFHFGSAPQEALMKLIPHMKELKPRLVVIDIMQRFLRLKKIDDYAEAITKMEPVISVARGLKCCIALNHHSPKMEREIVDSGLGSIGLTGSVDTVILIRKEREGWRSIQTLQRYHKSGKRDIEGLVTSLASDGITLKLEGTRFEVEKAELKRLILEVLQKMEESITEPQIRDMVKKDECLTRECLRELVENGEVERTGAGIKHNPYRFSIAQLDIVN